MAHILLVLTVTPFDTRHAKFPDSYGFFVELGGMVEWIVVDPTARFDDASSQADGLK